ncbi:transcriptional regulator, Crp/Fnr family protein [marine gamma proteobacterium HTCC2148]|nr:transcriptional regulator, Crp/Fnr family protein [marine gamma proteobacterium HTCC2148]MDG1387646.1 Crp/Fnr family transcriptional regulator [Halioglobus sp.]
MNPEHKQPLTIYSGLCPSDMQRLDAMVIYRNLDSGDYLFHQHTPARSVYVLEEGIMMMERSSSTGRRQVMAFMQPGNFIGIPHNQHYDYTVSALQTSRVQEMALKPFVELQDDISQLKENVRGIGGNILAHTLDQVFALGQKKAHERVCFLLKQLSDRALVPGSRSIELVMTRQDIADYLGLTIETVSRAFGKLKREKVIDIFSAHTVEIIDMEAVEEMALAD